jgi:hypothetical protein
MLGTCFASSEKVSELDFSRRSAGRHVGFVQDEGASIVVATEQPSVAVLAVVNLALAIGSLASAETINRNPISFRKSQAQGYSRSHSAISKRSQEVGGNILAGG